MNASTITFTSLISHLLNYRFYARFISKRISPIFEPGSIIIFSWLPALILVNSGSIFNESFHNAATLLLPFSFLVVFFEVISEGDLILLPLFNSLNSLIIIVLTLGLICIKKYRITLISVILISSIIFNAAVFNFFTLVESRKYMFLSIPFVIVAYQVWIILEGVKAFSTICKPGNKLKH